MTRRRHLELQRYNRARRRRIRPAGQDGPVARLRNGKWWRRIRQFAALRRTGIRLPLALGWAARTQMRPRPGTVAMDMSGRPRHAHDGGSKPFAAKRFSFTTRAAGAAGLWFGRRSTAAQLSMRGNGTQAATAAMDVYTKSTSLRRTTWRVGSACIEVVHRRTRSYDVGTFTVGTDRRRDSWRELCIAVVQPAAAGCRNTGDATCGFGRRAGSGGGGAGGPRAALSNTGHRRVVTLEDAGSGNNRRNRFTGVARKLVPEATTASSSSSRTPARTSGPNRNAGGRWSRRPGVYFDSKADKLQVTGGVQSQFRILRQRRPSDRTRSL